MNAQNIVAPTKRKHLLYDGKLFLKKIAEVLDVFLLKILFQENLAQHVLHVGSPTPWKDLPILFP